MFRKTVQWLTLLASNAYLPGFWRGRIYKGPLKSFCVPGLNCYSCPGAIASCPLGALQAAAGPACFGIGFYAAGLLLGFGTLFGRFVCGFLCPFGLLQELLYKIPFPRRQTARSARAWPRRVKYVLLALFVLAPPLYAAYAGVAGSPAFCKYICPAGTLTAGLPLLTVNASLRGAVGALFFWKMAVAVAVVVGCLRTLRFFCKYLCPLGAIYGLFNRVAVYRLCLTPENCVSCGACRRVCPMDVDPARDPDSAECIRCGDCVRACGFSALRAGFAVRGAQHGETGRRADAETPSPGV